MNERLAARLRGVEALLEDALRDPPSGFVVLDPGTVPEYPVENKMKIVIFLAFPNRQRAPRIVGRVTPRVPRAQVGDTGGGRLLGEGAGACLDAVAERSARAR